MNLASLCCSMDINLYNIDFDRGHKEVPPTGDDFSNEDISSDLQKLISKLVQKRLNINPENIRDFDISREGDKLHLKIKVGKKVSSYEIDDANYLNEFDEIVNKVESQFKRIHLEKRVKHKDQSQIIEILKSISFYFLQLRPNAKVAINKSLDDSKNLEDVYIHPENLYREIELSAKGWESFYTPDEFHKLIDKMLVKDINTRNKKTWNRDKLNQLKATRVAAKIAKNEISEENIDSELATVDHMKIPIEELLKIEIDESNKAAMSHLWKSLLLNSFNSIELSDEENSSKQISGISSAKRYLLLRHQIPEQIKSDLEEDLKQMDSGRSLDKAMAHILTHSLQRTKPEELLIGATDDPVQLLKSVDSAVKISIPEDVELTGIYSMGHILSGEAEGLDTFLDQIWTEIDPDHNQSELPTLIANLYYHEMERYAIEELGATSAQIDKFRNLRTLPLDDQTDRTFEAIYSDTAINELKKSLETHPSGLTVDEQIGLILLNKCKLSYEGYSNLLSEKEKSELADFMAKAVNNKTLYNKLEKFLPPKDQQDHSFIDSLRRVAGWVFEIKSAKSKKTEIPPCGVGYSTIYELKSFINYTDDQKSDSISLDKARTLLNQYNDETVTIENDQKLTLHEIGRLLRLPNLLASGPLEIIHQQGVHQHNDDLKTLYDNAQNANILIEKIEDVILTESNSYYTDGSLMTTVAKKREATLARKSELEVKLASLISDLGVIHGAKLYHDDDGNAKISHLVLKYRNEPLNLHTILVSNVYELDVSNLVDPALYRLFENEWEAKSKIINNTYRDVEKELHKGLEKDDRMKEIVNDRRRRILAGLGDHHKLMRLLGQKKVKGHKQAMPFSADTIHSQFYEGEEFEQSQICSEFATKATIAALMEANIRIINDILSEPNFIHFRGEEVLKNLESLNLKPSSYEKNYLLSNTLKTDIKVSHIKETLNKKMLDAGYDPIEISAIFSLCEGKAIKLPYPPNERLETVHPGRMVKLLMNTNCVKKKAPPETLSKFVQAS